MKALGKLVARAAERRETGLCVVEGPRPVSVALAEADVQELFVEEGRYASLAAEAEDGGVPVSVVAEGVLAQVLSTVTPQPVAAVAARPDRSLDDLLLAMLDGDSVVGPGPVLVLAGVGDPGNVGTLLRSATAAGAAAVVVGPGTADPFGPKAIRSSAGAGFTIPVLAGEPAEAVTTCVGAGLVSVAAVAPHGSATADAGSGSIPYDQADLAGPCVLVLGAETAGVPEGLDIDLEVRIPHQGDAESLNVAMAGTVLLFEAARQRRAANDRGPGPGPA